MADVKELNKYLVEWARAGEQENNDCFSAYVRILRRRKGLTRSSLAAQIGIEEAMLIAIENDLISLKKIKPDQLQKVQMCLGMSYQDFLDVYSSITLSANEQSRGSSYSLLESDGIRYQ